MRFGINNIYYRQRNRQCIFDCGTITLESSYYKNNNFVRFVEEYSLLPVPRVLAHIRREIISEKYKYEPRKDIII